MIKHTLLFLIGLCLCIACDREESPKRNNLYVDKQKLTFDYTSIEQQLTIKNISDATMSFFLEYDSRILYKSSYGYNEVYSIAPNQEERIVLKVRWENIETDSLFSEIKIINCEGVVDDRLFNENVNINNQIVNLTDFDEHHNPTIGVSIALNKNVICLSDKPKDVGFDRETNQIYYLSKDDGCELCLFDVDNSYCKRIMLPHDVEYLAVSAGATYCAVAADTVVEIYQIEPFEHITTHTFSFPVQDVFLKGNEWCYVITDDGPMTRNQINYSINLMTNELSSQAARAALMVSALDGEMYYGMELNWLPRTYRLFSTTSGPMLSYKYIRTNCSAECVFVTNDEQFLLLGNHVYDLATDKLFTTLPFKAAFKAATQSSVTGCIYLLNESVNSPILSFNQEGFIQESSLYSLYHRSEMGNVISSVPHYLFSAKDKALLYTVNYSEDTDEWSIHILDL